MGGGREGSGRVAQKGERPLRDVYREAKVARGGPNEGYQDGVERAKGRIADINQILVFRQQTSEEQKRAEEAMKQRAAEEAVQQD
jgi:hypothetical protein